MIKDATHEAAELYCLANTQDSSLKDRRKRFVKDVDFELNYAGWFG